MTTPSNNTKPAFSGTASESLPVTVKIYSGSKVEGSPVATAEGPVSSEKWGPVSSSTVLTSGTYTAVAIEQSSLGNAPGRKRSGHVRGQHRNRRKSTIEPPPPARSKDNKPTFKGTASEAGTVTVHVYKGTEAKGEEAAKLTATVVGRQMDGERDGHACGRQIHGPGDRAERDRERAGVERSRPVRSLHETADGDDGSAGGTVERKQTDLQRHGQRTGPGDGPRLQGQRSERHRSAEIDSDGGGQRRMVGLAGVGAAGRNLHGGRDRAERDRQRTKAKANRRAPSQSSRNRRP